MRLYLIRHGRTRRDGPDSQAWPLSSAGEAEAARLVGAAFWSSVTAIYSSPELKALQTIRRVAERYALAVNVEEGLREVRRPPVWVVDYESVVRGFFERPEAPPDGWESAAAATARLTASITAIITRAPGAAVALCGHGLAWTLYVSTLDGAPVQAFELWRSIGFGQVAVVEEGQLLIPFSDPWEVRA